MNLLPILYEAIANRVKTLVPEVKWIDLWTRQTDFTETAEIIDFPAVFISFPNTTYGDMGRKSQECVHTIRVFVAYHNYESTSLNADSNERSSALKFLDYLQTISSGLHAYSSNETGTLSRINMQEHDSGTDVCVYYLDFETNLIDEGAKELQTPVIMLDANPNAEIIVKKEAVTPQQQPQNQTWFNFPP